MTTQTWAERNTCEADDGEAIVKTDRAWVSQNTVKPDFDYERVTDGAECPVCGEDAMDCLTWDDDGELVTCATCGTIYDPQTGLVTHEGEVD
jgi:rubredoxin